MKKFRVGLPQKEELSELHKKYLEVDHEAWVLYGLETSGADVRSVDLFDEAERLRQRLEREEGISYPKTR
jgi:hypothetical protein